MEFFNSAVDTLQTIVVGLGGALCVWGGVNLWRDTGRTTRQAMLICGKEAKSKQTAITAIPKQEEHGRNVHKPMLYYN